MAYQYGLNYKSNRYVPLLFFLFWIGYGFAGTNYRTTITMTYDNKNVPVTTFLNNPANLVTITSTAGANDTLFISDGDTLLIDNVVFDMSNFLLPVIVVIEGKDSSPGKGGMIYFKGGKGEMKLNLGSNIFVNPDNKDGISFSVSGGSNQGNGGPNSGDQNQTGGNTLITIGEEKISAKEIKALIELGSLGKFLPVELIFFQARPQGQTVALTWQTAWELDNDYFEVEHSKDGARFVALSRVKGSGTADFRINYQYVHREPFPGVNYYRLRQVDFDGQFAYSNVVAVQTDKDVSLDFTFAPNPARGRIEVQLPKLPEKPLRLWLSNGLGQVRQLQFDRLGSNLQVELPEALAPGLYWLHLDDGQSRTVKPMVVQ